ncbi:hypothetical protein NL526_29935, partial [Klebsiella pneumoniae]|nr:hypothetical protein [Klebsiella pneumoniae]
IHTPVLAIALVHARLTAHRLKYLLAVGLLVMLTISLIIPGRIVFIEKLKREEPLARPYSELADKLRQAVDGATYIVANTR